MSRIPVPEHLIHKLEEVKENAKRFDAFVNLIPENDLIFFKDFREVREFIASQTLENIRQKVEKEGRVFLPFGLVVRRDS